MEARCAALGAQSLNPLDHQGSPLGFVLTRKEGEVFLCPLGPLPMSRPQSPVALHGSSLSPFLCEHVTLTFELKKVILWGVPGGSVVKNPPANAGDTDSIPGAPQQEKPPR